MRQPVLANGFYNGLKIAETQRFHNVTVSAAAIAFLDVEGVLGVAKDNNGGERQCFFSIKGAYLAEYGKTRAIALN